jgi:hypothetical protein
VRTGHCLQILHQRFRQITVPNRRSILQQWIQRICA